MLPPIVVLMEVWAGDCPSWWSCFLRASGWRLVVTLIVLIAKWKLLLSVWTCKCLFVTTSAGTLASPGFSSVPCQEKVQHGDGSETIHGNVVEKQNYICDLNLGNLLLYFGPPLTPSTPMSALLRYLQKAFLSPLVGSWRCTVALEWGWTVTGAWILVPFHSSLNVLVCSKNIFY